MAFRTTSKSQKEAPVRSFLLFPQTANGSDIDLESMASSQALAAKVRKSHGAVYARKVTAPGRPDFEGFETPGELNAISTFPVYVGTFIETHHRANSANASRRQGCYKEPTHSEERWSLFWIEARGGS